MAYALIVGGALNALFALTLAPLALFYLSGKLGAGTVVATRIFAWSNGLPAWLRPDDGVSLRSAIGLGLVVLAVAAVVLFLSGGRAPRLIAGLGAMWLVAAVVLLPGDSAWMKWAAATGSIDLAWGILCVHAVMLLIVAVAAIARGVQLARRPIALTPV